jgi:hypothetical protein
MRSSLVLLLLALASPALAAPHVVVGDFKGDKKSAAAKSLRSVVCARLSCVEPKKVGLPRKLDWKKAAKSKVQGVLTGTIAKGKLALKLQSNPGAPAQTWSFKLGKGGKLASADATQVREDLLNLFAPPSPPPTAPEPAPTPEPAPMPTPVPPSPAPAPKPAPRPESREPTPRSPVEAHVEPAPAREAGTPPLLHVELGLDLERRTLRYSNLASANLSEYEAPVIYSPRLRLEAYPLAQKLEGIPAGLGLLLDYRVAVGLKSAVEGGPTHPTRQSVFALDLRLRIPVGEEKQSAIIPFLGYRRAGFRVDPAADGTRFVGLPTILTGGPRFGVAVDLVPVEKLHVLGQADYVIALAKADLIGPDYFPSGSASVIEGELGLGYELVPHVDLRAVFEVSRTGFSFDPAGQSRYVASGASELLLGGRLMLGFGF